MRAKLALLVATSAVVFVLLEVVLRTIYEPAPIWIEPQIRHLRSPLLGWVLPPGGSGYNIDSHVRVNQIGLHDDEIPVEKPPGETRILCLGDSFTFALGVSFDDLYVQQLERQLNDQYAPRKFQVINAGVAGYNSRQELLYLLKSGLDLDPDAITIGFYWNDLVFNDEPLPDVARTPILDGEPDWKEEATDHAIPKWLRDSLRRSTLLYQLVRSIKQVAGLVSRPDDVYFQVQQAILTGDSEFLSDYWRSTEEQLLLIAEAGRERGVPVILMAFPMENQIRYQYPDAEYAERLRAIWSPSGQPFIDLEPAFRRAYKLGENPYLPYDLHPSAAGMRIAAEALHGALLRSPSLSLRPR